MGEIGVICRYVRDSSPVRIIGWFGVHPDVRVCAALDADLLEQWNDAFSGDRQSHLGIFGRFRTPYRRFNFRAKSYTAKTGHFGVKSFRGRFGNP